MQGRHQRSRAHAADIGQRRDAARRQIEPQQAGGRKHAEGMDGKHREACRHEHRRRRQSGEGGLGGKGDHHHEQHGRGHRGGAGQGTQRGLGDGHASCRGDQDRPRRCREKITRGQESGQGGRSLAHDETRAEPGDVMDERGCSGTRLRQGLRSDLDLRRFAATPAIEESSQWRRREEHEDPAEVADRVGDHGQADGIGRRLEAARHGDEIGRATNPAAGDAGQHLPGVRREPGPPDEPGCDEADENRERGYGEGEEQPRADPGHGPQIAGHEQQEHERRHERRKQLAAGGCHGLGLPP